MTDCLQAGYSITRQSVIAIYPFCINSELDFFFRLQSGLSISWALRRESPLTSTGPEKVQALSLSLALPARKQPVLAGTRGSCPNNLLDTFKPHQSESCFSILNALVSPQAIKIHELHPRATSQKYTMFPKNSTLAGPYS